MSGTPRIVVQGLFLLATLVGCGADTGGPVPAPPPSPPPAPPPPPPSVSQIIGAAGGTITGPGGVVLVIPEDALPADTRITVALDTTGAPPPPAGTSTVGPTISLLPHGLSFQSPVTLELPVAATAQAGTVTLKTSPGAATWEQLLPAESNGVARVALTGFSWVAVACCIPGPVVNGPNDITGVPEDGFWIFSVGAIGRAPLRYQWFRDNARLGGETNSSILLNPVHLSDDGARFHVDVTDDLGLVTSSRAARLGVVAVPPRIVNHPADVQVAAGGSATFSAASTSSIPQTLQWQRSDDQGQTWTDLTGATAPSYTLTNAHLTQDDGAWFRMRARNSSPFQPPSATSLPGRLTVTGGEVAPTIVRGPFALTVRAGVSATFTVTATGTSLDYAWERAPSAAGPFTPIAGATSASYTLSNPTLADNGSAYRLRVSNTVGTALSPAVVLTVLRASVVALVRVGGGVDHSVALRGDGTLISWGHNDVGQLGDGTRTDRLTPATVGLSCPVATFAAGGSYNLAVCDTGDVMGWGANTNGELGIPTSRMVETTPRPAVVGPVRQVSASSSAWGHSLAVLANNPLAAAWGSNRTGQLGDGSTSQSLDPGTVQNVSRVAGVAAGAGFSLVLRQDGTVLSFGANSVGQLGNGTLMAGLWPQPVAGLRNIIAVTAGALTAMAIDQDGTVFTWGLGGDGALGDGAGVNRLSPVAITLPGPAIAVSAGQYHGVALLEDGRVFAWGQNRFGQVGTGQFSAAHLSPQPVVGLPPGIIAIGAGARHTLAVDANLNVWAWGYNRRGQLGDGTTEDRATPVRVINGSLQ